MPHFDIVVAADEAGGIGKQGQLPWHLKGDMAYFKRLTQEPPTADTVNAVIMGRVTWQSIPEKFRPLPGRINVVISGNAAVPLPGDVIRAKSLDEAFATLERMAEGRVFVIGGGQIYSQAIVHRDLDTIYLTRVHATFDCDTRFPAIPAGFALAFESPPQTEGPLIYRFCEYRRVPAASTTRGESL